MERKRFNLVAAHLIASAGATEDYRRQFLDDHGTPPTLMAKVHHFRSLVQARVLEDDAYELAPAYTDFGRVEMIEAGTDDRFLLKSARALAVEQRKADRSQLVLFKVGTLLRPARVQVLVYEFDEVGVTLSIASAVKRSGGTRVFVKGNPVYIGFWPFQDDEDSGDAATFDQDVRDRFGDVGALNEGGENEAGAP